MSRLHRPLGAYPYDSEKTWVTDWWRSLRRQWGRVQQVRKGTRVRCRYCGGHPTAGGSPCPMCHDGFAGRDETLADLEDEMEMAHK